MVDEREAAMDAEKNIERSLDELSRLYESHVDDDPDILPVDLVVADRFENAFPQPVLDNEQKRLSHCSSDGSLHMDVSQYDDLVGDNVHRTSSVYVYKL